MIFSLFIKSLLYICAVKIINKTDIHLIECPLIAHIGDDFVIVEKINKSNIHFIQGDKKTTISLEDFQGKRVAVLPRWLSVSIQVF